MSEKKPVSVLDAGFLYDLRQMSRGKKDKKKFVRL